MFSDTDQRLFRLIRQSASAFHFIPDYRCQRIQKKKFLSSYRKGKKYFPVFQYPSRSSVLKKLLAKAAELEFDKSFIGGLLNNRSDYFINELKLIDSAGKSNEIFTANSKKVFGAPGDMLLKNSCEILEKESEAVDESPGPGNVLKAVKKAVSEAGLRGWKVQRVKGREFSVSVLPYDKKLLVNTDTVYSARSFRRMLVHELMTHAIRAENGARSPYRIALYGFPDYAFSEEGAAVYHEHLAGLLDRQRLKDYAARAFAVSIALKGSYYDTFAALRDKGFDEEHSYIMTFRVRCGLKDQALPGAYTRDWIYYGGFMKIKSAVENGRIGFSDLLQYGRTSWQYLNDYIEYLNGEPG